MSHSSGPTTLAACLHLGSYALQGGFCYTLPCFYPPTVISALLFPAVITIFTCHFLSFPNALSVCHHDMYDWQSVLQCSSLPSRSPKQVFLTHLAYWGYKYLVVHWKLEQSQHSFKCKKTILEPARPSQCEVWPSYSCSSYSCSHKNSSVYSCKFISASVRKPPLLTILWCKGLNCMIFHDLHHHCILWKHTKFCIFLSTGALEIANHNSAEYAHVNDYF